MANQHINDCIIEGARKNINPQVHYINWNHTHPGNQRLQVDLGRVVINERPEYEYSLGQRNSKTCEQLQPFVYTDLVINQTGAGIGKNVYESGERWAVVGGD